MEAVRPSTYLGLFTPPNLALLSDWLDESGELYVDVYWPHSGGGSTPYFVRSLRDLKELIKQQTWPEIGITVFRHIQYPLRGIADEFMITKALQQIPDGEWYRIVSLEEYYPSSCGFRGSGDSHAELRQDILSLTGQN